MINYFIGFIAGICSFKIYQITKIHMINKRCKKYVVECKNIDEFKKELEKIMNEMKEGERK